MRKTEANAQFDRLYDATYDNALHYVVESTGSFDAAEDILSETYSAVYKRMLRSGGEDIDDTRSYLFTCLKNAVSKHYAKKAESEISFEDITDEDCQPMIDTLLRTEVDVTESEAANHILIGKINDYLSKCAEAQRKVFILRIYYGYPLQMVAEKTGLPQSTVNNYVYRLLNDIRQKFLSDYVTK